MDSPPVDPLAAARAEVERLTRERKLLLHSLELHERDRQLLAFEIHDGIVQDMSAAHMFLEAARPGIQFASSAAENDFKKAVTLLKSSVADARRLIGGLIPVVLDEAGLQTSLQKLISRFEEEQGLSVDLRFASTLPPLAPAIQLIALRIVQESLTNVWRHSQSTKAAVTVGCAEQALQLTVQDWGVGFDPQQVKPTRYGLTGIRERARLLQGSASITSAPGEGATVSIRLPLPSGDG